MGILAADGPVPPEWLAYVNTGGTVGLLVLIIFFWMTGKIMRSGDVEKLLEAANSHCEVRVEALERETSRIREDLAHVIADRDAWREAHREDVAACQAAERAASQLMESANLTASLIALVRDSMGHGVGKVSDGDAKP